MTLIIGIKCRDGVVVGADGAATLGSMGTYTAGQPTKKLSILHNKIIVGVSGPVGLGQRLKGTMDTTWSAGGLTGKAPYEAMTIISRKFREHITPELEMANSARQSIGNVALQGVISSTLVALPISRVPCLFQFDQQGSPEEATEELPFVSIGSGQTIADPFLGLIRRVLWENQCPTIVEAIFATVWTLNHAIQTTPGGVSYPIQLMSLTKPATGDCIVKEYTDLELVEHNEAIRAAEASLRGFRASITQPQTTVDIPELENPAE